MSTGCGLGPDGGDRAASREAHARSPEMPVWTWAFVGVAPAFTGFSRPKKPGKARKCPGMPVLARDGEKGV
jgi:hypothetical protein